MGACVYACEGEREIKGNCEHRGGNKESCLEAVLTACRQPENGGGWVKVSLVFHG